MIIRGFETRGSIMLGYQFDQWKHVGRVGASNLDITLHGIILRLTLNY